MAIYFVRGGTGGTDAGTSWANAAESIPGLMAAQAIAGNDIIYVHNTHSFLAGASITWTLPESGSGIVAVICVDGGDAAFSNPAAMGTTVGNITTGAIESTNGNFSFTINTVSNANAVLFIHGMTIQTGSGSSQANADLVSLTGNSGRIIYSACNIWINSTNTGALATIGAASNLATQHVFIYCTFRQQQSNAVWFFGGDVTMYGCSSHASGSAPAVFFQLPSVRLNLQCWGCDWSRCTTAVITQASNAGLVTSKFVYCVIPTPVTGTNTASGHKNEFIASAAVDGSNGADMLSYYYEDGYGIVEDSQTVYQTTSGASGTQDDGTSTPYSLKITPSANVNKYIPICTPWMAKKIESTGSKTISVNVADTEGALLKDDELRIEVQFVGGAQVANAPQSQFEWSGPLQPSAVYIDPTTAGSNLTDTGEAWTGITETGTYTLSKAVTVDEQGFLLWRVALYKDTTNPVYVDMKTGVA